MTLNSTYANIFSFPEPAVSAAKNVNEAQRHPWACVVGESFS